MSQTGDLQIDEMMNYELSPYPYQLDKPQLAEVIRNYASAKSDNAISQTVPGMDHYVLDGGIAFAPLKMDGEVYLQFSCRWLCSVWCLWGWAKHKRLLINIENYRGRWKKDFLSNKKQAGNYPVHRGTCDRGCKVIQAEGDVEITKTAVTKSAFKSTTFVREDTDLLLLYAEATNCTELFMLGQGKIKCL